MRLSKILLAWLLLCASVHAAPSLVVGSKNFTESYLLAEIATQLLNARGIEAEHRQGLGGTKICYDALRNGDIDVYPEYSGTISSAILNTTGTENLNKALLKLELTTLAPLGFDNTYVLAIRREVAEQNNLRRISDLQRTHNINIALSHEFRARNDGWPALALHYGLNNKTAGIEHGLAYQAIESGSIDLTDAYSTDGELSRYDVVLLEDDLSFFPEYQALWLARSSLPETARAVLETLRGKLDEVAMQRLNARAVLDQESIPQIAASFLRENGLVDNDVVLAEERLWSSLLRNTLRHLQLSGLAIIGAALIGVLLSLACYSRPRLSRAVLSVCSLLQTVPSIALLALMIPLFGIGLVPALVALFLYALLPIVRATLTALNAVEPVHITVADALGMSISERRRLVLIPLAMPHILAGLRTAAVISIGTATLAAFVGAGGLGQPIVTGLALNNTSLILQGALPAAALAIITDLGFDWLERRWIPQHLRRQLKQQTI